MNPEKRIIKMEQRIDELAQKLKRIESQVMRRIESPDRHRRKTCPYCKVPLIGPEEICGNCKAILDNNKGVR